MKDTYFSDSPETARMRGQIDHHCFHRAVLIEVPMAYGPIVATFVYKCILSVCAACTRMQVILKSMVATNTELRMSVDDLKS